MYSWWSIVESKKSIKQIIRDTINQRFSAFIDLYIYKTRYDRIHQRRADRVDACACYG